MTGRPTPELDPNRPAQEIYPPMNGCKYIQDGWYYDAHGKLVEDGRQPEDMVKSRNDAMGVAAAGTTIPVADLKMEDLRSLLRQHNLPVPVKKSEAVELLRVAGITAIMVQDDTVAGAEGNDTVFGGAGDDTIDGGDAGDGLAH